MATPKQINWIPNLAGKVHPELDHAIRYLFGAVHDLRDGKAGPAAQPTKPPAPMKVGGDIIGTADNALLVTKGPGAGTYTGISSITLDENGRVVKIN